MGLKQRVPQLTTNHQAIGPHGFGREYRTEIKVAAQQHGISCRPTPPIILTLEWEQDKQKWAVLLPDRD